jgi:phosphopantothenoylcysteine synthetase/decarboxylase
MGLAIARAALRQGYRVDLISSIAVDAELMRRVKFIPFTTHAELKEAIEHSFVDADALIMAAAVVDYRPQIVATHKIKSTNLYLDLEDTEDILASLASKKQANQVVIGFSVETENDEVNAIQKLQNKNLDFIVVNSPEAFDSDIASVKFIYYTLYSSIPELVSSLVESSKDKIAEKILDSFNKIKPLQNKGLEIRSQVSSLD